MAWPGNKGMEGGDTQGPASREHCLDFTRCKLLHHRPWNSSSKFSSSGKAGEKAAREI